MKNKISHSVREIPQAIIRQMALKAIAYEDVISLGIGEPDFNTPEQVCQRALEDALAGATHYTPSRGDNELVAGLLKYIKRTRDIQLKPEQLMVTHGGMGGLIATLKAILDPGQEIIVIEPHFPSYKAQITFAGGSVIYVSTKFEEGFIVDPGEVEKAITPRTKGLIINSPNNPTGAVIPADVLDELARVAIKNDLIVISDEVYDKLVFVGSHESIYTRPGMKERTVVINSFSKAFAMTGWRIGYCYGPDWLIEESLKVSTYFTSCPSSVGQRAALAALNMDPAVFDQMARNFDSRNRLAYERLRKIPGVKVHPAQGGFYLFPNVEDLTKDTMEFALDLLHKEQVVVIPGGAFGPSGEGCVRIACTVDEQRLSEAMDRIERFVKNR